MRKIAVICMPIPPVPYVARKSVCPLCGYTAELLCCRGRTEGGPKPGSVMVCYGCKEVTVFDQHMELRRMTETEERALMLSSSWPAVVKLREEMIRHEGRQG